MKSSWIICRVFIEKIYFSNLKTFGHLFISIMSFPLLLPFCPQPPSSLYLKYLPIPKFFKDRLSLGSQQFLISNGGKYV